MDFVKLSIQDLTRIRTLFRSVFTREPWNDDWSDETQLNAFLTELIGNPNSLPLAYAEEDTLAAVAMGHIRHWYEGTEYYIDELCVRTDLQGQGLGGRFLDDIAAYLRRNGISAIFLLTDTDTPAYTFYQKHGFRVLEKNAALVKPLD